jgi:DNA repair protein RecN (Recombination protein N)
MLADLRIHNLAVIEDLEIAFEPGFNVITGETGAGKTILMRAIGLLLGDRGGADLIRDGAREAEVEALLAGPEVAAALAADDRELRAAGPAGRDEDAAPDAARAAAGTSDAAATNRPGEEAEDAAALPVDPVTSSGEATVRRVLTSGGRQRAFLNDRLVTTARLMELGARLVHVYGQHEHHTLLRADTQRAILDAAGGLEPFVAAMAASFRGLVRLEERLAAARAGVEGVAARRDLLAYQVHELRRAKVQAGEVEEIEREREQLRHAERLQVAAAEAEQALYAGEGAVVGTVSGLIGRLTGLAAIDPELGEAARLLDEARPLLEEAALRAGKRARGIVADPGRLECVEERIALLQRLARKHGCTPAALVERQDRLETELAEVSADAADPATLEREVAAAAAAAWEAADALSAARARAATALGKRITAGVRELALAGATLTVALESIEPGPATPPAHVRGGRALGVHGAERVAFLFTPAAGETPRPLARIASGGELSRIMLAMKAATAGRDDVPTLLFDEVDAGVGGAVAEAIGRKLALLARGRQVICITHLPQIAACADHHFVVRKHAGRGRRRAAVERLSDGDRVEELARMLAGVTITKEARRHAAELRRLGRRSPGG